MTKMFCSMTFDVSWMLKLNIHIRQSVVLVVILTMHMNGLRYVSGY